MKFIKSMSLILALMLTLAGCSGTDTANVAAYNDTKVPAGVYLYYMINNIYNASTLAENKDKSPLKQTIEGKNGNEWVIDKTKEDLMAHIAADVEFDRLKLTLTEETKGSVINAVKDTWENDASYYEKNGISKESLLEAALNYQKRSLVLENYYGENGEKSVSDSDALKYYEENYARINHLVISKSVESNGEQVPLSGEALVKVKEQANSYFEMLKKGESFETVLVAKEKADAAAQSKEEPAAHEHDNEFAHDIIVTKGQPYFPEKYLSQLFASEIGKPGFYEEDAMYIVFLRKDVNANPKDFETRKSQIGIFMQSENFNSELAEVAKTLDITVNDNAIKRYKPSNIKQK